ncbi:hypothetical protein LF599_06555 [Pseudodesulfovibrio thermohalotolerans]|uniref:hypothetical protein n=1 Tax=Pseudodesulfovibrio thermohalotolerans TaxID=2880651 RepID=UPI0024435C18|nr:hypothetical protein [Pseudodesulfovibrio thermohalotolerans]WFS63819.1 hypothetical protein LF599_06555 [Pseudodesulfovibrio thermohalotolerans]
MTNETNRNTGKYVPEIPVGTTLTQLTFDVETAEIVEAWKRQGLNITTVLILCGWYVVRSAETKLVTGYERSDFRGFGARLPRPLLEMAKSAAKTHGMNLSEFWDACVRTVARDSAAGALVPLSAILLAPLTRDELMSQGGK